MKKTKENPIDEAQLRESKKKARMEEQNRIDQEKYRIYYFSLSERDRQRLPKP